MIHPCLALTSNFASTIEANIQYFVNLQIFPQVTDTRITPRTVSRILAQEGSGVSQGGSESPPPPPPPPRGFHAPPMLPVSLPTSVAIPNPSLHESQVFSPYSPFFNPHAGHPGQVPPGVAGTHHLSASPPTGVDLRDSPPLPHPPAMLHPALLAAAQHGQPDYHLRMDSNDRGSDCNSGDISYDGIQPTISFYLMQLGYKNYYHFVYINNERGPRISVFA